MMKCTRIDPAFTVILAVFVLHQILQKVLQIGLPFLDAYLDPFCAGALALFLVRFERAKIFGRNYLSKLEIAVVTLVVIFISEFVLPTISHRFVQDWADALTIALGAQYYLVFKYRIKKGGAKVAQGPLRETAERG